MSAQTLVPYHVSRAFDLSFVVGRRSRNLLGRHLKYLLLQL